MDYIMNDIIIEEQHYGRLKHFYRILVYYYAMKKLTYGKSKIDDSNDTLLKRLWDREINWEQRIYRKLKMWEKRHPIMGIVICTILLGILISLIAGIILESIY